MKNHLFLILFPLLIGAPGHARAADADSCRTDWPEAVRLGEIDQAVLRERQRAVEQAPEGSRQRLSALLGLTVLYRDQGLYQAAREILRRAEALAEALPVSREHVLLHSYLGDVLLALQQPDAALPYLEHGLRLARQQQAPDLIAHVLNNLGNIHSARHAYSEAREMYRRAEDHARQCDDGMLRAGILLNLLRALIYQGQAPEAMARVFLQARDWIQTLPDTAETTQYRLSLGELGLRLHRAYPEQIELATVHQLFHRAGEAARKAEIPRLLAYAEGYLGQTYEQAGEFEQALRLTRRAIFLSQSYPELLYRWEWQRGRIYQQQEQLAQAVEAYRRALHYLQPIRSVLSNRQRDAGRFFREQIRPVYFGLADVLLRQAARSEEEKHKTALLRQARETVELLKAAELADYFQDECVAAVSHGTRHLDEMDPHTAVLYPILLADRVELLLSLPDGIHQVVVSVGEEQITQIVLEFRDNLQTRMHWRFIRQARQLYDWLIAPIHDLLAQHQIDTLVQVPDGPLRMIPLAALHDGEHYLIENYALAVTPGLDLTDPRALPRRDVNILLSGLSEGVQGFSPLPNVPEEIRNIRSLFEQGAVLLDQGFLLTDIDRNLQSHPYSIVHVASHGQFDRNPKNTFLLTYDTKLTIDRLEQLLAPNQWREKPVELLTLSACQTAVGDERAALGLAGVALKAGARSALATLWFVNDQATSRLVDRFYRYLRDSELSKAKALQRAQQQLAAEADSRHPAYWAPFLLIGNWL